MTAVISSKLLVSQRSQGLERHVSPRPRLQAVGEQGLEDLNSQPSAHSVSLGLSSSWERVLQDSQRPDSEADIAHTCVAQTHLRVCAVFPVSGISD